jgi:SRSO17 transposase
VRGGRGMGMVGSGCACTGEAGVADGAVQTVDDAVALLRPHFGRRAAHAHAAAYLRGLLADVERKNGWQLAEHAGYAHPRGIQRVLDRYAWDADAVRDDLRAYVVTALGDPAGVLVVDETGFPKQGTHSAGVARQYCGTLGKVANCQIGVFLGYAGPKGHAGIDRALYMPQEWLTDRERGRAAGLPAGLGQRTKPQLALELIERALDAGVPAAWVVADEIYGSDGKLRRALEGRDQAYVLAVRGNEQPSTWPPYGPPAKVAVAAVAATVPAAAWQRLSCGEGAQGPRLYDWACVPLRPALRDGWVHAVLHRRHPVRSEEIAYSLVYAPVGTPLEEIVRAAGTRWTIEETFKLAKGQVGLDHYEVRSWHGWYRHATLALLALAALVIGAGKGGGLLAPCTSRSPSPKSAVSSSASSGPRPRRPGGSVPGRAGGGATRKSPKSVIAVAA